jgi:hypothetical protein
MNIDADLIKRLSRSQVYAEYQKAFGEATKLPLALRPWQNEVFPGLGCFQFGLCLSHLAKIERVSFEPLPESA